MQILPEFDDEDQRFVTSFLDVMAVVPSRGIAVCASNQYVLKTQPNPWTNCFQWQIYKVFMKQQNICLKIISILIIGILCVRTHKKQPQKD